MTPGDATVSGGLRVGPVSLRGVAGIQARIRRVAFGVGALLTAAAALWIWIQGFRGLRDGRRDPTGDPAPPAPPGAAS